MTDRDYTERQLDAQEMLQSWLGRFYDMEKEFLLSEMMTALACIVAMGSQDEKQLRRGCKLVAEALPMMAQQFYDHRETTVARLRRRQH